MTVRPRQRHIIVRAVRRHFCERLMALAWLLGAKFLARVWVGKSAATALGCSRANGGVKMRYKAIKKVVASPNA